MDNGASSYLRFLGGDDDGLVEIVSEYKDGLILFLNGYVHNIYVAEDLMEDTFLKLMVKKPMFFNRYSFKTWLYTIGRNIALDYLRKESKVALLDNEVIEKAKSLEIALEKKFLLEERKIWVHQALKNIHDDYREVLFLKYFEELSNHEIGKVMKKNSSQVEMLIYRAKKSLKSELEKGGFVYEELR